MEYGQAEGDASSRLPVVKSGRHPVIPTHLWHAQHCVNDLLHQPSGGFRLTTGANNVQVTKQ
jgi:hypothetical protein